MILSGLSGNEMFCLGEKGWLPGNIVVGNSVYSLGVIRGFTSGLKTLSGGEIESITELISDGRHAAITRMEDEAAKQKAHGLTGVVSDLKKLASGHMEFLAIGSAIRGREYTGPFFTTACSGQDLYCQLDSGYQPRHFVMGNVAYALGLGRGLIGALRGFTGGEVKEYSDMYNHTRHLALTRLEREAAERGANSVVDIQTQIIPFGPGVREMLMVGTASHNPVLGDLKRPVTSELTGEELWNLTKMGYSPVRLVLGTSVYALGFAGGVASFFQSFARGEITQITELIYEARRNCLAHIRQEAEDLGADGVIGIKVHIYELGSGFVEILAVGTAIRKNPDVSVVSSQLMPQAIIRDRDTFFDLTHAAAGPQERELNRK